MNNCGCCVLCDFCVTENYVMMHIAQENILGASFDVTLCDCELLFQLPGPQLTGTFLSAFYRPAFDTTVLTLLNIVSTHSREVFLQSITTRYGS